MTPEDIEQLRRLKALKDDGVITEAEFEAQKQLVLNSGFVEPVLKSTSALESGSEKLGVPREEPRPNVFDGLGWSCRLWRKRGFSVIEARCPCIESGNV